MAKDFSIEDMLKNSSVPLVDVTKKTDSIETENNFLLGKKIKNVRKKSILDDLDDTDDTNDTTVSSTYKQFIPIESVEGLPVKLKTIVDQQVPQVPQVVPLKTVEADVTSPINIISSNIKIPTTLAELQQESFVNDIQTITTKKQKFQLVTQKNIIPVDEILHQEAVQQVTQALQEVTGVEIEKKFDALEVRDELIDAVAEIPGAKDLNLTNVELTITKKDKDSKAGYFKVKVNIKKDGIPNIINKIASYVKSETIGLLSPRVCDLRVIGNTNKTQLRGSVLALSASTIVFKPNANKLKVNKGTRIMISVSEDFVSTGNLLVYIQESRMKSIHKIDRSSFDTEAKFINFIAERIVEYYVVGYQATLARITLYSKQNPLTEIMSKVLKTGQYKGKPVFDDDNMFGFDIATKSDINQWLTVRVFESTVVPNKYEISAFNTVNGDEFELLNGPKTYQEIDRIVLQIIDNAFAKDWSTEISDDEDPEYNDFMYNLQKITHFKLRKVAIEIWDAGHNDTMSQDIKMPKMLSKNDMAKLGVSDYDSEAILGITNIGDNKSEWVLTYLAYPIIAGDTRHGSDYITRDQYYQKYSVKDKNQYQRRKNTVIVKEGASRNYNARIYLFQLEYKSASKSHIYRAKTFKEILETGFLTGDLKYPKTKF